MLKKTMLVCSLLLIGAVGSQAITLRGTVTNASTNAPVVGAIVSLTMGANVYMDTTITGGTYELITRNNTTTTGLLLVTATGYNLNNQLVSGLNVVDTVNVALTPTGGPVTGTKKIVGMVTIASGPNAGNAISGARVILYSGTGGMTPVDTVQSAGTGRYVFDSLSAGRYDIIATATGYSQNTAIIVNLTQAMDSSVANIALAPVATGTVTGKVTATDTTVLIANAKVLLTRTVNVGGVATTTHVDSGTTNASGVYTIDNVPVATGYRLTVSAAGYDTATSPNTFVVQNGVTRTENFRLQAYRAPAGIVNGTVADSATAAAVPAAKVVLRRQQTNFTWMRIDSMSTDNSGKFAFTGLDIGTYSLVVSKTDYNTYTTPVNRSLNLTTNPDTATVTVSLIPLPKGNLLVFVQDNSNAGIGTASVTAVGSGAAAQTFNGLTAASGWVSFPGVPTGTYSLTVSKTGYNTATSAGNAVTNGANDTVKVTLTTATGTLKVVKGTVKNGSGTGIGTAVVVLTARFNTNTITLVDTCGSNGTYLIGGIPVGYTLASLAVSKAGYLTKDTANFDITADTTTVNVTLVAVVSVQAGLGHAHAALSVALSRHGIEVRLGDENAPARVMLYSANGRLVLDRTVAQSGSSLVIPRKWSNQVMMLTVRQGDKIIRQKVTIQ